MRNGCAKLPQGPLRGLQVGSNSKLRTSGSGRGSAAAIHEVFSCPFTLDMPDCPSRLSLEMIQGSLCLLPHSAFSFLTYSDASLVDEVRGHA
jgi:hypothetical protein